LGPEYAAIPLIALLMEFRDSSSGSLLPDWGICNREAAMGCEE